jgi:very-short-patch-repair endonuclease
MTKNLRRDGNDVADEILQAAKQEAADMLAFQYGAGAAVCDSPIEKILLAQLLHPQWARELDTVASVLLPPSKLVAHAVAPPIAGIWIWPQIIIDTYRVDFIIGYQSGSVYSEVIVECDGHDFHERTKLQAFRDKRRDRALVAKGYRVLRFTGSEIFNRSEEVVGEIIDILRDAR